MNNLLNKANNQQRSTRDKSQEDLHLDPNSLIY